MARAVTGEKAENAQEDWVGLPRLGSADLNDGLGMPSALTGNDVAQMIAICSGPGMGKSFIASRLVQAAKDRGYRVVSTAFQDMTPESARKKLVRVCRDTLATVQQHSRTLVVIDGVAPGDEQQTFSEAAALGRLISGGCQVLLCVRPESEQLVEALSNPLVIRTDELTFKAYDERSVFYQLSGGIPSLVVALRGDAALTASTPELGSRYLAALCKLMSALLGPWLPEEEYRVRLAMMLLGQGTMDDVALVAGRCDAEMLTWINHDTPFFGIDLRDKTFCCRGISDDDVFRRCSGLLHEHAAAEATVVSRACGMLVSTGRTNRSATVCGLSPSQQSLAGACIAWGVSYIEIGAIDLVENALNAVDTTPRVDRTRLKLTQAALACVTMGLRELSMRLGELRSLSCETSTEVRLLQRVKMLGRCRMFWRNPWQAYNGGESAVDDTFCLVGANHLAVSRAICMGHFGEAYAKIASELSLGKPTTLFSALLCDDMMLSLALIGGAPDSQERYLISATDDFFRHARFTQIGAYHRACAAMLPVLMSDALDDGAVEEGALRAERWGDSFLQVAFLIAAAISDLHAQAFSRAHVRASKALKIARDLDLGYLEHAAELVCATVHYNMGVQEAFETCCTSSDCPSALSLLAALAKDAVKSCSGEKDIADPLVGVPCPRDALWAMNMLLSDCGAVSEELFASMPQSWLDQYRSMRARNQEERQRHEIAVTSVERLQTSGAMRVGVQEEILPRPVVDQRIRINVFGSFCVLIDGKKLPDSRFDRRRSRDLLMLLAVAPLHRMPRYQLVEQLWPGDDYIRGPRKLYEATAEARKHLRPEGERALNAVVADKAQGSIGLNPSIVGCDVDDFLREAVALLAEDGDDYLVLERARRMEQLYAGGPDAHVMVLGQRAVDRANELKSMYVDGMVAAGEAALRLGRGKLAVRYAQEAHRLIELREDAVILLVHALRATGRAFEIPGVYRRFARTLIESQGVSPSAALRHAVDISMGGGYESMSA